VPAICRLILFWKVWPGFRVVGVSGWAEFAEHTFRPIGILAALHVPLFSIGTLGVISVLHAIFAGCALIGFLYPVAGIGAALLDVYLGWIGQSSGKINHGGLLLTCALFPIAFARAADAWSVDALIRRLRGKPLPETSPAYRWPQRFIAAMVVTMYGAAGLTKLTRTGLVWGDSLRTYFLSHQFTHFPPTRIGPWIAQSRPACRVLGVMALCLEISSPLSQLSRWAYRAIIPSLAFLQFSIWLIMGVLFREMILVFACLLPWEALLALADARVAAWQRVRAAAAE